MIKKIERFPSIDTDLELSENETITYREIKNDSDEVIRKFYPKELSQYSQSIAVTLERSDVKATNKELEDSLSDRVMSAAFIIRYFDDFIDDVLWPKFRELKEAGRLGEEEEEKFASFLETSLTYAEKFDPYMPKEIIELPKIELHLLIHDDQQTFDENIEDYIHYKSLDIAHINEYLVKRILSASPELYEPKDLIHYKVLATKDVSRDADYAGENDSQDFDVFEHIKSNDLDPRKFIELLKNLLVQIDDFRENYEHSRRDKPYLEGLILYLEREFQYRDFV